MINITFAILCFCPLSLATKLYFDSSKVANLTVEAQNIYSLLTIPATIRNARFLWDISDI